MPNVFYLMNLGLLQAAMSQENVKVVIVNIGSNDSKPGRSLSEAQIYELSLYLTALRAFPQARIVVTGQFHKKDVYLSDVNQSSDDLEKVVSGFPRVE